MNASAVLKKGEGRTVKKGGLWIYDNEIARIEGTYENGAVIGVKDFDGFFMGWGYINDHSKIRIRLLSRREDLPVTDDLLRQRVRDCLAYRKDIIDMSSCRLVFGEADYLPGLTVDKFSDVLVVECLTLGMDLMKEKIMGYLKEELALMGMPIRGIYERSDAKVRELEGLSRFKGFMGPEFDTQVLIEENGVKYYVDVKDGQKTGFFLDQKLNRRAVAGLCRGKKVLDCFTHTGSFGLNAAKGGAASVLAVDASDTGIAQAEKNAVLNNLQDIIRFQVADVFELLPALEAEGQLYDVVVLDPPAFTKSRNSIKNAVKGYREINLRGMRLVKNGGYLATCSCSHFMDPELFAKTIREAANGAHKTLRQVYFSTQAPDHPIAWNA
ncbi:MAG: class I SAM-dependent rRNA methyltransferase, partial [Lachnospiraceae bacterium]|nr:class I SAM-dependent rRNA methyltransferase [Lachnospiraceae bacterium]